jgi:chitinase
VAKVEFFRGTTRLGEDTSAPYTLQWTFGVGNHTLTARATDNGFATATSSPRTIRVKKR